MGVGDAGLVHAAPVTVRLAGLAVVLQGLAVLGACVLLVSAGSGFAVWGFFALLGAVVVVLGGGLVLGRQSVRGPVVVLELLTLGVAFYATVGSARPEWGVPAAVLAAAVLAGVLSQRAREWAAQ